MDHYQQIGISPHASTEEILDKCDDLSKSDDLKQQLEAGMARTMLGDPMQRIAYDIEYLKSKSRQPVQQMIPQSQTLPSQNQIINNYGNPQPVSSGNSGMGFIFGCFAASFTAVFVSFAIIVMVGI